MIMGNRIKESNKIRIMRVMKDKESSNDDDEMK